MDSSDLKLERVYLKLLYEGDYVNSSIVPVFTDNKKETAKVLTLDDIDDKDIIKLFRVVEALEKWRPNFRVRDFTIFNVLNSTFNTKIIANSVITGRMCRLCILDQGYKEDTKKNILELFNTFKQDKYKTFAMV